MDEFPTPQRLSRVTSSPKSTVSSSSSYAKKLQTAFTLNLPSNPTLLTLRCPAWNRLPIDIEYSNSTNRDFPPLPAKPNPDETRSTASSTNLTFTGDSIKKAIAEAKSEWQNMTREFQAEICQSNTGLNISIKTMIDESLATQVKKIVSATVTEFGDNENLSKHFITRQELQGTVQSFTKEMTRQIQNLQNQQGTTTRKRPAKKQHMSPASPTNFDYGTPDSHAMEEDHDNDPHARGLSFGNEYDTPPRGGSKRV
jgi:hypothetical protein